MEWGQGKVLNLIAIYESRPLLWDSKHHSFNDKFKRKRAWAEIAEHFDCHPSDVEKKIFNLKGQYRRERRKILVSRKLYPDDPYKTKWFAYYRMNKIMRDYTSPTEAEETEEKEDLEISVKREFSSDEEPFEPVIQSPEHLSNLYPANEEHQYSNGFQEARLTKKKKIVQDDSLRMVEDVNFAEDVVLEPFCSIQEEAKPGLQKQSIVADATAAEPSRTVAAPAAVSSSLHRDEFSLFGELVTTHLRKISDPKELATVKHAINTVIFESEMGKYKQPSNPKILAASSYNSSVQTPEWHYSAVQPQPP